MQILRFNPLVWIALLAVSFIAYFVRISPDFDLPFKIGYTVACFSIAYFILAFENWRVKTAQPNWKERCEEMELKK
jgi:hypothetical protein